MKNKSKNFLFMHIVFFACSTCSTFSKLASQQTLFSNMFFLFYGLMFIDLVIYTLLWQQIIKHTPLTTAIANKAIMTIWGIMWSIIIFKETISIKMIFGTIFILIGMIMVVRDNE